MVIPADQLEYDASREAEVPMYDVKIKTVIIHNDQVDQLLTEFLGGNIMSILRTRTAISRVECSGCFFS